MGGPHTPAVGWAAGIERLAMLVGSRWRSGWTWVVVVENDAALFAATSANTAFRQAGFATELITAGSPRKRYDKALRMNPRATLVFETSAGAVTTRLRPLAEDFDQTRAGAVLAGLPSPSGEGSGVGNEGAAEFASAPAPTPGPASPSLAPPLKGRGK